MIIPEQVSDGSWWLASNRKIAGGLTYGEAAAVASMINRMLLEKRLKNAVATANISDGGGL